MKLYYYDHCPFCCRARMILKRKGIAFERQILLEDDVATPTALIGRKMVPILDKDDGSPIGESMDIVRFVDGLAEPSVLRGVADGAAEAWYKAVWPTALRLLIPRFTDGDFAELATPSAREAYRLREERAFGDLDALIAQTPALLSQMAVHLEGLESWLASRTRIDEGDFLIFPVLRSLTIVERLTFSPAAHGYVERVAAQTGVPLLFDQAR